MSSDLDVLIVAFGPVQGLVSASRKTKDLARGSALMSMLVAAAADAGDRLGVNVVVPPPGRRAAEGLSNKLVLLVAAGTGHLVGGQLRTAAERRLQAIANETLKRCPSGSIDETTYIRQVGSFLECYWASAPLVGDDFGASRAVAEERLDGRKALRDFGPYVGVPDRDKASADGRFEGVMDAEQRKRVRTRFPAATRDTEQVDAIGLIRRLWAGFDQQAVPSTVGFATRSWFEGMRANAKGQAALKTVDSARSELLARAEAVSGDRIDLDGADEWDWVLEEPLQRGRELETELSTLSSGTIPPELGQAMQDYNRACDDARAVGKELDLRSSPYYAVISADGDRMGKAFAAQKSSVSQQHASESLAQFGDTLRQRTAGDGVHIVYAGGDDLLAFAPLDAALPFVTEVRRAFKAAAQAFESQPSISIGVAIVHCQERLGEALRLARVAEGHAKEAGRPTLIGHTCLLLSKRGGADLWVVQPSTDDNDTSFHGLVNAVRTGSIPRGAAHDVRDLGRRLVQVDDVSVAIHEIRRVLTRKRDQRNKELDAATVNGLLDLSGIAAAHNSRVLERGCERLSVLLRIALHFAEHSSLGAHT